MIYIWEDFEGFDAMPSKPNLEKVIKWQTSDFRSYSKDMFESKNLPACLNIKLKPDKTLRDFNECFADLYINFNDQTSLSTLYYNEYVSCILLLLVKQPIVPQVDKGKCRYFVQNIFKALLLICLYS